MLKHFIFCTDDRCFRIDLCNFLLIINDPNPSEELTKNDMLLLIRLLKAQTESDIQGGSNMTGTNCDLFTHKSSRSYLNHLVCSYHARCFWDLRAGYTNHNNSLTKSLMWSISKKAGVICEMETSSEIQFYVFRILLSTQTLFWYFS
jgi:hypothetical protein